MAKWDELAASAISGSLSLVGIPWQQQLQKDLMHENAAINLSQWNRENAYNHPREQMKRLREAGLNPDLVYGGNVSNTASSAQLTDGTPAAPFASSAVSQAVRNAQDAALVGSQVDLNEARASEASASSNEHDVNTVFKWKSLDASLQEIWSRVFTNKQQIAESQERVNVYQAQCEDIFSGIRLRGVQIMNLDTDRLLTRQRVRNESFQADMNFKRLQKFDDLLSADLNETLSRIGVNTAQASYFRAYANTLRSTLEAQLNLLTNQSHAAYWQAFSNRSQMHYYNALTDVQVQTLQYLPYQMASAMFEGRKVFSYDDNGNMKKDENGLPVVRGSYADWQRSMDNVNAFLQNTHLLTQSFMNVGIGIGAMKGAPVGSNGYSVSNENVSSNPPKSNSFNPMDNKEYRKLYELWKNAPQGSKEKSRLYGQLVRFQFD